MNKTPALFACIASAVLAIPAIAFAQYSGQGLGSALSSDPLSHQGQVRPGVDDTAGPAAQETPFKIIKDVKLGASRYTRARSTCHVERRGFA